MASFKDVIIGTAGVPATCTITSDESDFTDATPFEIQIVFDKAVTGFVVGDITITKATLSNFAGSGASYTADVTPNLSGGDIAISIDADVTAEGNSASNTVTVTDNYVAPLVLDLRGRDAGGEFTDFAGMAGDNSTYASDTLTINTDTNSANSMALNVFFPTLAIAAPNVLETYSLKMSRTRLSTPSGISYDHPNNYLNGMIIGWVEAASVDGVNINKANYRGYRVEDTTFSVKVCRVDSLTCVIISPSGRTVTSFNAPATHDIELRLSHNSTNWVISFYSDDVLIGSQVGAASPTLGKMIPYLHSSLAYNEGTSIEQFTNIESGLV